MIDRNMNLIYNEEYLVIVPKIDDIYIEAFSYSFGNTILMDNDVEEIKRIHDFIIENNFKKLIFVDYRAEYEEIINNLPDEYEISMIFTSPIGALSDKYILNLFNNLFRMYKDKICSQIGFLDKGFYDTFKSKNESVKYIQLDLQKNDDVNPNYDNNIIGILNSEHNYRHSFYNELSAIKLSNKYKAKLHNPIKLTKRFIKLFDIPVIKCSTEELYKNNAANLYVNFTDNNNLVFIKSMDIGIPCILGNNSLLSDNELLNNYLTLKSDDDINEIKEKVDNTIKNREKILNEYQKFRKEYTEKSKKSIEEFIGIKKVKNNHKSEDLLLSVIVPVYNTEKYLRTSLNSIVEASCENMEVLIINDGSTDDSEKIIIEYAEKYPELIRYIKQKNGGLGNVRNTGLREAKGKYLASVDSDDTINENFFVEAMPYLYNDVDVVMYDWLSIKESGESFETPAIEWSLKDLGKYKGLLYSSIMPSTCNKIMKKSIIDELGIKYVEDKYEDLSTNPLVLLKAKTIKYINKPYYEYYLRSGSLMRSSAGYSMINIIKELDSRINKLIDIVNVDIEEFKYYTYSWRIEEFVMNQLYTIDKKELGKYIKYIYDNIYDICIELFNNKLYLDMLDNLNNKDMKEYITKRNKSIVDKKLEDFIKKNDDIYKLTPAIIYYGDN